MEIHEKHLEDLKEIRSLMERSSRFISLSGLSGVFAGMYAIAGATAVWMYTNSNPLMKYIVNSNFFNINSNKSTSEIKLEFITFLFIDACIVLTLALSTGIYLTTRQAKKKGQSIWDNSSKRMIINLAIPLITGGLFSLALLYHSFIGFVAPSMLIFYGLALINGSKYTLTDILYLGFCEIALGLMAMMYIGYGLLFWAIGFGVMHIVYGAIMYFKYER
jgi:hypothetical protein